MVATAVLGCAAILGIDEDYTRHEGGSSAGGGGAGGSGTGGSGTGGSGGDCLCTTPAAGQALEFDGSGDVVRLPALVASDFTIEAWILTDTAPSGDYWEGDAIVSADVSGGADDFAITAVDDVLAFGVGDTTNQAYEVRSTTTITTGQWVHIAAVRSQAEGRIQVLVNGVVEGESSNGDFTQALSDPPEFLVGSHEWDSSGGLTGKIDELRIWDTARTPAEIDCSKGRTLTGDEPGLVGYWRFDETSGDAAPDATPNGNDGTLGSGPGAPEWVASDAPVFSCD